MTLVAEAVTIRPHCRSTGGVGQSLGFVSWGRRTDPEFTLCWRLHPAQMQRAQSNQWEREQQPEGQEGPHPQSHGAASVFGEGEKTHKHTNTLTHSSLFSGGFWSLSPPLSFSGLQMGWWWYLPAGISASGQVSITWGSWASPAGAGTLPGQRWPEPADGPQHHLDRIWGCAKPAVQGERVNQTTSLYISDRNNLMQLHEWSMSSDQCYINSPLMTSCISGPSGEDFPEAGVYAGDVWQEEGQPEEACSQTDQASAACGTETWGLHQIPSQLTWSVPTQPHRHFVLHYAEGFHVLYSLPDTSALVC